MRKGYFLYLLLGILLVVHSGVAARENSMPYHKIADVPGKAWQQLAEKRIFFGHQSVGFNIVEGISLIMERQPQVHLNIREGRQASLFAEPGFVHARIGSNRDPMGKMDDFQHLLSSEIGKHLDIALLKLCYVDIDHSTDVLQVFNHYTAMVETIEKQLPSLRLIHCTVPLKTMQITWKTRLKRLLGKEAWEFTDNIKRNQYNKLLLKKYNTGDSFMFDLAQAEATGPDGRQTKFTVNGTDYLALSPGYSSDGGHLNLAGSAVVAEQLLLTLLRAASVK